MIKIVIESVITLDTRGLPTKVKKLILRDTTYRDPLYAIKRRMGYSTYGMRSKIKTHTLRGNRLKLWRGYLPRLIRILRAHNVEYDLLDQRLWLPKIDLSNSIVLRDYQEDPANVMIKRQQALGRGECSSGKTETLLFVAAHFEQPTLVLIWQERQQRVWIERIRQYFDFQPGGIGGAFPEPMIEPITIGMVQSVGNHLARYKYLFGALICDELSRFAAPTLRSVVNAFPAAVRLGASDDERRRDGREFLLYDSFGKPSWKMTTGQCAVDIFLVPTKYKGPELDDEEELSDLHWATLINDLTADERRNNQIVDLAVSQVHDRQRVLIWSDRVEHCRLLKDRLEKRGVKVGLLLGGPTNKKACNATETGLNAGVLDVGIGTSVAEQSINIPPLSVGIMTCPSADRKLYRFKQMRGRLARPHSDERGDKRSRLFYIWDQRIPSLRRKAYNINRRYSYKILRQTTKSKRS